MSFVWRDYLALAEALNRNPNIPGPEEAALRCAISRAYYAAFGTARLYAASEGYKTRRTGEDHSQIIAHFRFSPDQVRRNIGFDVYRLRDNRSKADYDANLPRAASQMAQSSVDIARNVLSALVGLTQASKQGSDD